MAGRSESRYDVIVVGVGGMGSAALYHLAARGRRVLGLERFDVPNDMGSSHGITRIIRLAYYEDPSYVPLLRRSYELWRDLQRQAGEQILHVFGSVDAGPPTSAVVEGALRACAEYDLPHDVLSSAELTRRYPGYRLPADTVAVFQPEGGFLLPERCIVDHVVVAQQHGAEVHGRERVLEWQPRSYGVEVRTDRGVYDAEHLVITAGAWASTLIEPAATLLVPERQVLAWLQPRRLEHFQPDQFPVFNLVVDEGRYYGFPVFGVPGFKFGRYHHRDERVDPETIDRDGRPVDEALLRAFAERYFPDGAGPTMALKVCMFTNTPDEHFLIDRHPEFPQVSFGAGFSGHGFKFCSVVGEILADLATTGSTGHDISLFRLARFGAG
jgi:sarcosine oxidase